MTALVLPLPESLGPRYSYIDAVVIRAYRPLPANLAQRLRGQCSSFWQRRMYNPAPGRRHWQILITRPTSEFWELIAPSLQEIDGHINQIEFAIDYVLASDEDAHMLEEYLACHALQRWHGSRRTNKHKGTWYWSKRRWVSNQLVIYADQTCRITGELHCVHLEWRVKGVQAVNRTIGSVAGLAHFDHVAFWRDKLRLAAVDPEKLGRRTRRKGRNRRSPVMRYLGRLGTINMDKREGHLRLRILGHRADPEALLPLPLAQDVKDAYRLKPSGDLVQLDATPLLPQQSDACDNAHKP